MKIRKSTPADLPAILKIYENARAFMRDSGNPTQWGNNHPPREAAEADIAHGESYVCEKENEILAVFFFSTRPDPTYTKIDGAWPNNQPYGVIHRIARAKNAHGAGEFCIRWCQSQIPDIRIDTHEANTPMLNLLHKLGFTRCGIIWLENGEERVALQSSK